MLVFAELSGGHSVPIGNSVPFSSRPGTQFQGLVGQRNIWFATRPTGDPVAQNTFEQDSHSVPTNHLVAQLSDQRTHLLVVVAKCLLQMRSYRFIMVTPYVPPESARESNLPACLLLRRTTRCTSRFRKLCQPSSAKWPFEEMVKPSGCCITSRVS